MMKLRQFNDDGDDGDDDDDGGDVQDLSDTMADFQFYALFQVKFFSSPWIARTEEFEAEIQIHGIYILPIEPIHTRVGRLLHSEWRKYINLRIGKYFFLLGEIFTTHFLCQSHSEQMGRGVPSDLVGIWKIIL